MKQSRCTDGQIVAVLKEVELGAKVVEACRQHSISEPACSLEASVHRHECLQPGAAA